MYTDEELKKLTVTVGKRVMTLSPMFLEANNAEENADEILQKFKIKYEIFEKMDNTDDPTELKEYAKQVTENEYLIQELFNFDRNKNFHRFWEIPKCKCPHMDNQDAWGTKYDYITSDCPIHWEGKK